MERVFLDIIDEIKEQLTDGKYKELMDTLQKINDDKDEIYELTVVTSTPSLGTDLTCEDDYHFESGTIFTKEYKKLNSDEAAEIEYDISEKGRHVIGFDKTGVEIKGMTVYTTRYVTNIKKI